MELRHLRYFIAVAETGHITRAAERLGMAQPPLSQQIRGLETELGVTLFHRRPRGVELTAAGEAFLKEARLVLDGATRAAARAVEAARGDAGEIVIGVTTSAILHPLIAQVVATLGLRHPQVAISVHEGNAADITEGLVNRTCNIAFLRAPVARPDGVAFERLATEPMLVVLPASHRLAAATSIALADLAEDRFVLTRRPAMPGMYDDLLRACREAGFEPRVAAEVGRMLTNINLVSAGIGVSLVPASMRSIRLPGLRYVKLIGAPGLAAPLTVARLIADDSPVVRNLLAIVRELQPRNTLSKTARP